MVRAIQEEGDERPENVRRAERRGASRLYANERLDPGPLLQHVQQHSVKMFMSLPRLLVAHDTTEVDLSGRYEPDDAGPLRSSKARGYLLHYGVVLDPSNEARAGALNVETWTRPYPKGKRPEDKIRVALTWDNEDDKWAQGVKQAHRMLLCNGFKGSVRHLADHEGSYNTLAKAKRRKRNYVARTKVDRNIAEGNGKLFDYLLEQPVLACWDIEVEEEPKSHARGTTRRRRPARVELRFAPKVTLQAPSTYKKRGYRDGLPLSAVYVYEPSPPPDCEPLSWMLLSVEPLKTQHDAEEAVLDYKCRWGVEEMNKVLKSGCHAELAAVHDLASFRRLLVVALPIAAHLLRWTYAARVTPLEAAPRTWARR